MKRLLMLLRLSTGTAEATTALSIGDGDTVRVADNGRQLTIRLACIDAPETVQRPCGDQARSVLQQLAPAGSEVTLRIRRYLSQSDPSRYLRLEQQAQREGMGAWSVGANGTTRPWDCRCGTGSSRASIRRK